MHSFRGLAIPATTHLFSGSLAKNIERPKLRGYVIQRWFYTIVVRLEGTMTDIYADPLDWADADAEKPITQMPAFLAGPVPPSHPDAI